MGAGLGLLPFSPVARARLSARLCRPPSLAPIHYFELRPMPRIHARAHGCFETPGPWGCRSLLTAESGQCIRPSWQAGSMRFASFGSRGMEEQTGAAAHSGRLQCNTHHEELPPRITAGQASAAPASPRVPAPHSSPRIKSGRSLTAKRRESRSIRIPPGPRRVSIVADTATLCSAANPGTSSVEMRHRRRGARMPSPSLNRAPSACSKPIRPAPASAAQGCPTHPSRPHVSPRTIRFSSRSPAQPRTAWVAVSARSPDCSPGHVSISSRFQMFGGRTLQDSAQRGGGDGHHIP